MHTIYVEYAAEQSAAPSQDQITKWATTALTHYPKECELSVRIVSEAEMTELNHVFRQKNKPTNVLSFPSELPETVASDLPLLGDIAICATVVEKEAKEQQKESAAHWAHMVIHGVLHLLGYDHVNDADAEKMEALEIELLQQLGFNNPYQHGE